MVSAADIPTPPSTCPACGLDPDRGFVRRTGTILTAAYVCKLGHAWETKWAVLDVFGDES